MRCALAASRPLLAALLLAPLSLAACGGERKPNVVLITMDTTRADYLSCYGYADAAGRATTPNLDRLAAEGARFELAISTAAVTPVSHASILTGRFNRDHGVRVIYAGSGFRLADGVPTLGTELQRAGYATLAVHSAFPVSPYFGLTRGFDVVDSFDAEMSVGPAGQASWSQQNTRRSDETIGRALAAVARAEEPFFLWVHLWDPHDAIQLPEDEFMPPKDQLFELGPDGRPKRDENGEPILKRPMTPLYAAEVRYMDHQIGALFDGLRERGLWDDTLVAVTADHGQGLGDHGWAAHRILYQEQIRVPLILRVPGAKAPRVVEELVRTVDIAPTLLDYAGERPLAGIAGRSLRPLLEGADDEPRVTFADQINGYDLNAAMTVKRPKDDFVYCAMDGRFKLVWRPNHPEDSELFDLAADPKEQRSLWAWDHPEALRLKRALAEHAPWVTAPFPVEEDGASLQAAAARLADLGYTGGGDEPGDEPLGPAWEFVCPEHYGSRSPTLARCGQCSAPMLLIAAGK
jgi:arylsulfatase A-like enzyme